MFVKKLFTKLCVGSFYLLSNRWFSELGELMSLANFRSRLCDHCFLAVKHIPFQEN